MKVVILAGGLGTRLAEETEIRPKPMVEVGGRPILYHIMKYYSHFGFKDFVIALGYRGDSIKRFILDCQAINGNMTVDFATGRVASRDQDCTDWVVDLVDTGMDTATGGRVGRLRDLIGDSTFMLTYGDGLADVDLNALLAFHKKQGKIATVTAVRPPSRFGGLVLKGNVVSEFEEKPQIGEGWINGGFLVFQPEVFKYITGDDVSLEADVLEKLAEKGQLAAFRHEAFWQCMDTMRDKRLLESLWHEGNAPWQVWT